MILVKDSAIEFFAPATGFIKPLTGECPMEVAIPSFPSKSKAITPQLFRGNCSGPTHCCLATNPPTHLSTLFVNQSLHATASSCNTLATKSCKFVFLEGAIGANWRSTVLSAIIVLGELPNISSKAKFIGESPVFEDWKENRSSPVTSPTSYMGARSLSAIFLSVSMSFFPITKPIRSCDSLPIISLAESVGSPIGKAFKSILPPVSSTNSDKQFRCPPAPWS